MTALTVGTQFNANFSSTTAGGWPAWQIPNPIGYVNLTLDASAAPTSTNAVHLTLYNQSSHTGSFRKERLVPSATSNGTLMQFVAPGIFGVTGGSLSIESSLTACSLTSLVVGVTDNVTLKAETSNLVSALASF